MIPIEVGPFSGNQKPVREGVYKRTNKHGEPRFAYWDGRLWKAYAFSVDGALLNNHMVSVYQDELDWYGVSYDAS
jgi:hypothetical protein